MRCQLVRDYHFEAAHRLPRVPPEHKCSRVHGHSYHVAVVLCGDVDPELGWIMDFAELDGAVEPVLAELDHRFLNEIPGLGNPTCEVLAGWLWQRIRPGLSLLVELSVSETASSRCVYRGE